MPSRLRAWVPALFLCGCAANSEDKSAPTDGGAPETGDVGVDADGGVDAGFTPDVSGDVPTTPVTPIIYASTDTELWEMDPATKKVTRIGPFDFGSLPVENVTDIAVDKDGKLFATSETTVFSVTLPAAGTGKVTLTKKLALPTGSRFFALGMAPEGVLEPTEALVTGDSLGDLYYLPTAGGAPQKLGTFGKVLAGDPPGGKTGDVWQLSGDVVFFSVGGLPRGLATVRPCTTAGACVNGNDVVAEIDMTELAKKSPTAKLRKGFLGSGTGQSRLFGVGAWDDKVYGFTLVSKGTSAVPAQLVSIDGSGAGTVIQTFPAIADGWSGAGVTTKATITIIK